ncbi:MAG: hypothetical protein WC714_28790 [Candidatus Obscuribacterales bacterium]|jgi:predicted Rossmann fold nucleotide-binding protein DprA/Smf involved in DNA uptake
MNNDALMNAYYAWTGQAEIPNLIEYAEIGEMLAAEFGAMERPAMAENCASRARQYRELAVYMDGATREKSGNFVKIVPVKNNKARQEVLAVIAKGLVSAEQIRKELDYSITHVQHVLSELVQERVIMCEGGAHDWKYSLWGDAQIVTRL